MYNVGKNSFEIPNFIKRGPRAVAARVLRLLCSSAAEEDSLHMSLMNVNTISHRMLVLHCVCPPIHLYLMP